MCGCGAWVWQSSGSPFALLPAPVGPAKGGFTVALSFKPTRLAREKDPAELGVRVGNERWQEWQLWPVGNCHFFPFPRFVCRAKLLSLEWMK